MGVFKNDVGRPSNKTIMIRNILKAVLVIILICIVFSAGYLFKNGNFNQNISNSRVSKNVEVLDINSTEVNKLIVPFNNFMHEASDEELYKAEVVKTEDLSIEYKNRLAYARLFMEKYYRQNTVDILKSSDLEEYYHKVFGKKEEYIPKSFSSYGIDTLSMSYDKTEDVYYADMVAGDWTGYRYANKFYKAEKIGNKIELYEYVVVYNEKLDKDIHKIGVFSNIDDADNYKNLLKEFDYESIGDMDNINKYKYITNHYKLTFEKEDGNYIFKQIEKIENKNIVRNQQIYNKYTIKKVEDKESEDYHEILFEGKKIELGTQYRQLIDDITVNNKLVYITTNFYEDGNLFVLDDKGNVITVFEGKLGSENKKYDAIRLSGDWFYGEFLINDDDTITVISQNISNDYEGTLCSAQSDEIMKYEETYKYNNGKFKKVGAKKYSAKEIIKKEYVNCMD